MFTKIISWVRDWINKMLGKTELKQTMDIDVNMSPEMISAVEKWSLMYENNSPWLTKEIRGLNLAAAISSEIARAVTIEMEVKIDGSSRAKFLAEQYEAVQDQLRKQVEYGAAKGGLMLKPYIDGKEIKVDFVQGDQFYPVDYDSSGNITACVFADQKTKGKFFYTRLEYHNLTDKGIEVINSAFRSTTRDTLGTKVPLESVEDWKDIKPEALIAGVKRPLYAYFRYPLVNNIDPGSPLGVSCFSRAVELIEQADVTWSNLLWEMESGKRALYVDVLALGKDQDGKPVLPVSRLYRQLDMGGTADELFKEWSPTLREANILNALNAVVKKIEFNCGLAYGTLSDPNMVDKTATEIISAKQRSAATIADTQKALRQAIDDLLYAMDIWATLAKLAPRGKINTTFKFDDSLLVDTATQFSQDLQLLSAGVMGKIEWRMRNFKETESKAREMIAKAANEMTEFGFDQEEE